MKNWYNLIVSQNAKFLKYKFLFVKKISPKKLISRNNTQPKLPNTLTTLQGRNTKVKFMSRILEKFMSYPKPNEK
jgi:hypothetical protein